MTSPLGKPLALPRIEFAEALSIDVGSTTLPFVKTFGLTGGIGMGKSTAADLLRKRGLPVVDSDIIARQVVEPGQPALAEIQQAFGKEIVAAEGRLRRDALAQRVFADTEARRKLEEIL